MEILLAPLQFCLASVRGGTVPSSVPRSPSWLCILSVPGSAAKMAAARYFSSSPLHVYPGACFQICICMGLLRGDFLGLEEEMT